MFSVQVLLAIGALALGWIIPRAVRLIGIIYTMVNVNGPNAEAFFASARHSGKVLPWVPLVGRKAHLVMDPSMINKTFLLDRTVLDGHQLFFQLDRILFGGSLDWLNHGAAFEGALASMIVNLRHAVRPLYLLFINHPFKPVDRVPMNWAQRIEKPLKHLLRISWNGWRPSRMAK